MADNRGWFVDVSDSEDGVPPAPYQLFIQCDGLCLSLDGIWFRTEQDAEAFLRSDILGKGLLDG